jgi:hypothetical protein
LIGVDDSQEVITAGAKAEAGPQAGGYYDLIYAFSVLPT